MLKPDRWSVTHFFGGAVLFSIFFSYGFIGIKAFIFTAILGVLWELFDQGYADHLCSINLDWVFDPRGADIVDAILVMLGAGLAWVCYLLFF